MTIDMSTLYRKYRPQAWSEVAGQAHIKTTLAFEVASGKTAHAYLFSGPRGVGKTTTARILAKALNCIERAKLQTADPAAGEPCGTCLSCVAITENRALDVIEMDAASNRGIDAVRDNVVANARFTPAQSRYKVFIIDEVHMLTTEAFNALLKTLEEPPAHAVFILATTETHKVPATILSRCQRFDFRKIPFGELVGRLGRLAENEGCKVEERVLDEIARGADGSLRDAESLLGKVLAVGDGKRVSYDEASLVLPRTDADAVAGIVDALLRRDARATLSALHIGLDDGADAERLADGIIDTLRTALVAKVGGVETIAFDADEASKKRIADWSSLANAADLVQAIESLIEKRREMKVATPTQLPLELALIRLCGTNGENERMREQENERRRDVSLRKEAIAAVPTKETPSAAKMAVGEVVVEVAVDMEVVAEVADMAPVAAVSAPITTVERIQASWSDFMSRAGAINAGMPFLLAAGKPIEVEGKIVRIGFEFAFHKEKLNQEKNRRILEEALAAVVGGDVRIEGVLLEKKSDMGHTDTAQEPVPALVGNVLDAFGGKVVE